MYVQGHLLIATRRRRRGARLVAWVVHDMFIGCELSVLPSSPIVVVPVSTCISIASISRRSYTARGSRLTAHTRPRLGCTLPRSAMEILSSAEVEQAIKCWCSYENVVLPQVATFDRFVESSLKEIVMENSELRIESERRNVVHELRFADVFIRSPSIREADGTHRVLLPHEARIRGLNYNFSVFANVVHSTKPGNGEKESVKTYAEVLLCKLPCMLKSKACNLRHRRGTVLVGEDPLAPPGIFVVNGNEKCVVAQEKLRTNFPFVKCTGERSFVAEIRSLHCSKTRSTSTLHLSLVSKAGAGNGTISIQLPFIDASIPAGVIFRLLGFESIREIVDFIVTHFPSDGCKDEREVVRLSLSHSLESSLVSEAPSALIDYIGREGTKEPTHSRRTRYVEHILVNEFLPHMGLSSSSECQGRKASLLALILLKLTRVALGFLPADDRDDFRLKRVDSCGMLFALLFRQLFRNYLKMISLTMQRAVESQKFLNITEIVNPKKITAGFKFALSVGAWGIQHSNSQAGVAQMLARQTSIATWSHLRRVNTPINREGKIPKPRELSSTHYGILCPVETPEGAACGLVENYSLTTHVRVGSSSSLLTKQLLRTGLFAPLGAKGLLLEPGHWHVLVNGTLEGSVLDGEELARELRRRRALGMFPCDCTIATAPDRRLIIDVDAGCLMRPLLRVDRAHEFKAGLRQLPPPIFWKTMLQRGVVELIDKNEEANVTVALDGLCREGCTHVDIHPCCFLGIVAGQIPFLNSNQAPRNIYESAMAKQAIGIFALNYEDRVDAIAHVLHYPQNPLVTTLMYSALNCDATPASTNTVVAILTYTGYNQEDSLIFNQASLDRGLFRSTVFRSYKEEEKGIGSDVERFGLIPENAVGARHANYATVEMDGAPALKELLHTNDVVIAKKMITSQVGADKKKTAVVVDHSTVLGTGESMRVNKVYASQNKDGSKIIRVRLHAIRVPEVGDKFSSSHGQKGVIGAILPASLMPYTQDGIIPDIIINPHAIPSRMTVAQLLECVVSKTCCLEGKPGDGTPFEEKDVISMTEDILVKHGYESHGNEILFSGYTGAPFHTTIFIGPTAYKKLRHCVVDKLHSRARGPVQLITRQPCEGRSRGGGLRVGEMEKDVILAHGASATLLDRLKKNSDEFEIAVCRKCGHIAEWTNPAVTLTTQSSRLFCRHCKLSGSAHIGIVSVPYSFALLCRELNGLQIVSRIRLEDPATRQ